MLAVRDNTEKSICADDARLIYTILTGKNEEGGD